MPKCVICEDRLAEVETRDGRHICWQCAWEYTYCEICGSTRLNKDQNPDEQLHFEEECFK